MNRLHTALQELDSLDALAQRPTVLSRLDPRAKILVTLAFIGTVLSFDRYRVAALLPFALFIVLMARLGDISLRMIARKVLMASPFAVMVGMWNPWLDLAPQMILLGHSIAGGWVSFASILVRFGLTVSASLVLVASTGLPLLGSGLHRLGVPQVFTTQLLFLHRYALVLAGEAARMNLARELRSGGQGALPLAVYASLLGHLLLRAVARSQRIYRAMLSRGFDGRWQSGQALAWRWGDSLFLLVCCSSFWLARQVDGVQGLGRWLMLRLS